MRKNIRRSILAPVVVVAAATAILPAAARAEEGGSGHYTPGQNATSIDTLPEREGFSFFSDSFYYNGSITGKKSPIELGGLVARNVEASYYVETGRVLYEGPGEILGADYGLELAVPWVSMNVKGTVTTGTTTTRKVSDGTQGLGDIYFRPLMLSWNHEDLKWGAMFTVYAPTGNYAVSHLANVGKNYWTFEPGVSFTYLGSDNGLEIDAFAGMDFNTRNNDTEYTSGDQFHLDATLAKHLPLFGGDFSFGATGFYYEQFTSDSGSGFHITKPNFGRASGIGPVFAYTRKLGKVDAAAEFKWLPDITAANRLSGDGFWLKVQFNF